MDAIDHSSQYISSQADLIELEEGISISQILQGMSKEKAQLEYIVLKRITQTSPHFQALLKYNPDLSIQNRYASIIPFHHNLITLPLLPSETQDSQTYINASPVNIINAHDYLIQTQAPLDSTLTAFWKLIWFKQVKYVFMLCTLKYQQQVQCLQYWPQEQGDKIRLPQNKDILKFSWESDNQEVEMEVELIEITNMDAINGDISNNLVKRVFQISKYENDQWIKRQVIQIQFKNWKDNEVLVEEHFQDLGIIFKIAQENLDERNAGKNQDRLLVHCSAGIGRTGTFICIFEQIQIINKQIQIAKTDQDFMNIKLSIFSSLRKIREQRWGMIKTENQYFFVYEYLQYYLQLTQKKQTTK